MDLRGYLTVSAASWSVWMREVSSSSDSPEKLLKERSGEFSSIFRVISGVIASEAASEELSPPPVMSEARLVIMERMTGAVRSSARSSATVVFLWMWKGSCVSVTKRTVYVRRISLEEAPARIS